jgi:hypothetical protein
MSLTRSMGQVDFGGYWNFQNTPFQFGVPGNSPQTAALMLGGGSEASPLTTSTDSKSFIKLYAQTTSTAEDNRLMYLWYFANGSAATGAEALRVRCINKYAGAAAIRGGSFAAGVDATGQITGEAYGVQATYEALAATRVMTGTIACLGLKSFVASGNTVPASHSFIRCADEGNVGFTNLLDLADFTEGTTSSTVLCSSSTDDTSTHRIKIRGPGGVTMWLMATSTAPH